MGIQHRCGFCDKQNSKLLRCTACQVVRYCSREHQAAHRPEHKSICTTIKKCRNKVAKEDHAIRNATPDFMTPANAFETNAGNFWGIVSTRPYMRARFDLADTIRRIGTLDGVTEALDHLLDMIRLCRSDNMGLRDIVPPLMLQLDRDQECYDFIKWYQTTGQRSDYDWGDMDEPFLDVKNADVLENTDFLTQKYGFLQHISAAMLLKLKLLVDLIDIQLTRAVVANRFPPELCKQIEVIVVRSKISRQWAGKSGEELGHVQQTLQFHIKLLARAAQKANEHFLSTLLEADKYLAISPSVYSPGSFEEMVLLLRHSYDAWSQHGNVLELLRSAKIIAGKDSEEEIEGMMDSQTFRTHPGSDRTKEELLDDVSRNRLWGYFDDAVEDAMSLNVTRPSDLKRMKMKAWLAEEEDDESEEDDDDGSEEEENWSE